MAAHGAPASAMTHLRLHLVDEQWFASEHLQVADMDAELWSQLPGAILETVLESLPAPSRARFRAVSKEWNALLEPPRQAPLLPAAVCLFQRIPDSAFLAMFRDIHNPLTVQKAPECLSQPRCWIHDLDLDSLPHCFRGFHQNVSFLHQNVSFQSGLVCRADWGDRSVAVSLLNLHNSSWRELPLLSFEGLVPREDWKGPGKVLLAAEQDSYKVVAMAQCRYPADVVGVYCSRSGAWSSRVHPSGLGLDVVRNPLVMISKDLMYARVGGKTLEMLVLDVETGVEVQRVKQLPGEGNGNSVHLAVYQDRLLWVDVEKEEVGQGQRLSVWMLHGRSEKFEEVAVMPEELVEEMRVAFSARISASAHKGFSYSVKNVKVSGNVLFIVLTEDLAYIVRGRYILSRRQTHVVAYHLTLASWRVVLHDGFYHRHIEFLEPRPLLCL